MVKKNLILTTVTLALFTGVQAQVMLDNDMSSITSATPALTPQFINSDAGWHVGNEAWSLNGAETGITNGPVAGRSHIRGVFRAFEVDGLNASSNAITIELTYTSPVDIIVAAWGATGTVNSTNTTTMMRGSEQRRWAGDQDFVEDFSASDLTVFDLSGGGSLTPTGVAGTYAAGTTITSAITIDFADITGLSNASELTAFGLTFSTVSDPALATATLDHVTITAVPEPSTFALLGGLVAMTAVMVRRRK